LKNIVIDVESVLSFEKYAEKYAEKYRISYD